MDSFELLSCTIFGESLMWEGSQPGRWRQVKISHSTRDKPRIDIAPDLRIQIDSAQQGAELGLHISHLHYTNLSEILAEKPGVVMNNSNTINYLQEIDNMLIHFTRIFKY